MHSDSSLYEGCPEDSNWGSGCLIIRNNTILMGLRSDNKLWCTPGGKVEPGETPIQGIIREVFEESGLHISESDLDYVGQCYSLNESVIWNSFVFVSRCFFGDLKPQPGEMDELKWVPISEIYNYNLFTPTRESIRLTLQLHPELIYPDIYDVMKLTSLEQLVDVKNPGRNGGNGMIGSTGNWKYTKPGQPKQDVKTSRPTPIRPNNQIQQIRQSYVQYFQNKKDVKKIYSVQDGKFIFPEYNTAKAQGIVKDKEAYRVLFNEQYMLFVAASRT